MHFTEQIERNRFGEWANDRLVPSHTLNCYDNSIYYTDQLLEQIIQHLDAKQTPSILVYTSDHADDVIQARQHNSALFTDAMTTIPLFVWANDEWRHQHPDVWQAIVANKDKAFSNDLMFESMAGLIGIKNKSININHDFSSSSFKPPSVVKTLHGRHVVSNPNNWDYWQTHNAQELRDQGLLLGAINVDSIAKAKIALNLGIKNIHINVIESDNNTLEIIDAKFQKFGFKLGEFLKYFENPIFKETGFKVVVSVYKPKREISEIEDVIKQLNLAHGANVSIDQSLLSKKGFKLSSANLLRDTEMASLKPLNIIYLDVSTQFSLP